LEDILKTLAGAPELPRSSSGSLFLRQQQMLARLAQQFHVDETTLRARLAELRRPAGRSSAVQPASAARPQLTVWERELFEILVLHPSLVGLALQKVGDQHLTSQAAGQLWAQYRQLELTDEGIEFERMLTAVEDPALKHLLVDMDESARNKAADALEDAEVRLHGLLRQWQDQWQRRVHTEALATLENRKYDEQEELALLEEMIQHERNRQGISAPTDG
jgi:hypothetical protein